MEWLTSPDIWIALITLSTLEIVLGVDNLVFVSIAVSRLPPDRRPRARRFGLALACITRIMLLLSLAYLARMDSALFTLFDQEFSIRDLVLIGGGLFLLVKGTMEIHDAVEGRSELLVRLVDAALARQRDAGGRAHAVGVGVDVLEHAVGRDALDRAHRDLRDAGDDAERGDHDRQLVVLPEPRHRDCCTRLSLTFQMNEST